MKKPILLLTIFLMVMGNAQDFKYGVTANFHKGSIVGVHDRSIGKFGGNLGMFFQFPLVDNDIFDSAWLYLEPHVEYSMQGENAEVKKDVYGLQKFHHDYITGTVYVKYFFNNKGYKKDFFVFAGPQIQLLVRENRKVDPEYDRTHYKYNLDDKVNSFGYGVSLGAGLRIDDEIEAFIRFDRGFSKVYPNNDRNNTYNRFLGIGINYYLQDLFERRTF